MSTTRRKLEVLNAVRQLKRARAEDVISHVARVMGEDSKSSAFRKAVHRDLKSYVDCHEFGVELFTPNGEPIEPERESEHSNIRLEYYLLKSKIQGVTGSQIFSDHGGLMLASSIVSPGLNVSLDLLNVPKGSLVISVELTSGRFAHVWFHPDERPIMFYFARMIPALQTREAQVQLVECLQAREVMILLTNKSISRIKENSFTGHAAIGFSEKDDVIKVVDHESSRGTFVAELKEAKSFLADIASDHTLESSQRLIPNQRVQVSMEGKLPALITLGNVIVKVFKK